MDFLLDLHVSKHRKPLTGRIPVLWKITGGQPSQHKCCHTSLRTNWILQNPSAGLVFFPFNKHPRREPANKRKPTVFFETLLSPQKAVKYNPGTVLT